MLDMIRSIYMYHCVKSRVKYQNMLSEDLTSLLHVGVRQGGSLSAFIFSMYLNDIEE